MKYTSIRALKAYLKANYVSQKSRDKCVVRARRVRQPKDTRSLARIRDKRDGEAVTLFEAGKYMVRFACTMPGSPQMCPAIKEAHESLQSLVVLCHGCHGR